MLRLERVVTSDAKAGDADMADRKPALQFVVSGPVQPVRDANRGRSARSLQTGKAGRVVDDIVGQQNLLPPAGLHVAGGSVVQAAKDADPGEQQNVFAVPEGV